MIQKKIKILYTIPNFDTAGSGKVVYDLVKNLDRSVFEPEICCYHNKGAFFKEIEKLNVKVHLFPFAINYRPFFTFPFRLLKTIRFFRKHKFDLIHSWHWSSDFSEPLAAKLAGVKWIYTKKAMGWGNKAWKWRSYLSTKIIIINEDMKLFFKEYKPNKVKDIPLGVDTNFYKPKITNRNIPLDGLKINEEDFLIVSVVNLIPKKGIEILIKAILEINSPKIKLLVVGDKRGEYAQKLLKLSEGNQNIKFLGKKLDVRPYLSIANIFAIPTLPIAEGLPIAPLEAMASGTIVIGSNVSGVKDILAPFPNCVFETNDVKSLRNCIIDMMNMNDEDHINLKKIMRERAVNTYSIERFINSHTDLYKEIIFK